MREDGYVPIPRQPEREFYPVSVAQRSAWLREQLHPGQLFYTGSRIFQLDGPLDRDRLRRALQLWVDRYDVLRSTIRAIDGEPVQSSGPLPVELPLSELDAVRAHEQQAELDRRVREILRVPFPLERGPLCRFHLFRLAPAEHYLVLGFHHIVVDGLSLRQIVKELMAFYHHRSLPAPRIQFQDFAVWQNQRLESGELAASRRYWLERLGGELPVLDLPADRPRSLTPNYAGANLVRHFPPELRGALKALRRQRSTTFFRTLLAAFQVLLHRLTGESDVIVGSPLAGRPHPDLRDQIGFFVTTPGLRTDLSGNPSFVEVLARTDETVKGAARHQDYPFEKLLDELDTERDPSRQPVYSAVLTQRVVTPPQRFGELLLSHWDFYFDVAPYGELMMVLADTEEQEQLLCAFIYRTALFDRTTVERWLSGLESLLRAVVANPEARISELPLMRAAERHRVVVESNDTATASPRQPLIHELFAIRARERPEALAVAGRETELSYGELCERAGRLSRELCRLGIGPEKRVGVLSRGCPEMIIGFLAVLEAGGAFVPIDPDYPLERIALVLDDAGISVLLTLSEMAERLPAFAGPVFWLDAEPPRAAADAGPPQRRPAPANLAYVIYTSGSTGRPKGVEVEHRQLLHFVDWHQASYGIAARDRAAQIASPSFDGSIWEIWPTLAAGASLHFPDPEIRTSAPELVQWMAAESITRSFVPTPLAEALLEQRWPAETRLVRLVTGGDALIRRPSPEMPFELINIYGPTETTVCVTTGRVGVGRPGDRLPAIGRPNANARIYLLDAQMRPVPLGVAGELLIGGRSLSRGYLGQPALSARRFVPDPFAAAPGERLYRTGDRVRYLADGEFEFLGRFDHQVKLRGYRVEPGEVEALLRRHPGVREAVAVVREDTPGVRRLVAYVVAAGGEDCPADELAGLLAAKLPAFMVPGAFVFLAEMPKNAHGKVNRRALPAPPDEASEDGFVAPRDGLEREIAEIWSEMLGMKRLSVAENLYHLGGNSLLATRLLSRVNRALGTEVPLSRFLPEPTVAALARAVSEARGEESAGAEAALPPIPRLPASDSYRLSAAQRGAWVREQLYPGNLTYNIYRVLRIRGELSAARLGGALRAWIGRHDVLRATFFTAGNEPRQRFGRPAVDLPTVDLSALGADHQRAQLIGQMRAVQKLPFDLEAGPLYRFHLFRRAAREHLLGLCVHHLVTDGISLELAAKELMALYQGRPLAPLRIRYQDYAAWQAARLESGELEASRRYWMERLGGELPVLDLPTDRPRPAIPSYDGATCARLLGRDLGEALEALAKAHSTTLFRTLFAAFKVLLHRLSREQDLIVGSPLAGRTHPELMHQVGFFVTTPGLRTDLSGDPPFVEVLARLDRAVTEALEHQDYPFDTLLEELRMERELSRLPVYSVLFNQRPLAPPERYGELTVSHWDYFVALAPYELMGFVTATPDGIQMAFNHRTELFDPTTIKRWLAAFEHLLQGIVADPRTPISQLSMIAASQRHLVLAEWNDTRAAYRRDRRLHELFEAQVTLTPEAVALSDEHRRLSYRELDARADRLACHLLSLGVVPEARVGVCLERSPEMVVSLMAVLKAGGAYLPLDPEYPRERLAFMIEDAGVPLVLTEERLLAHLPERGPRTICLDPGWETVPAAAEARPRPRVACEQLAYAIYTSGSTGRPKGVINTHRGIVNRLLWMQQEYRLGADDRVLQKTPFSFDVSVWEFFWPLATGAQLVVARPGGHRDAAYLAKLIARERITTLHFVPSMLQVFVEEKGLEQLGSLKRVIASGETLPAALERRFFHRLTCELHNLYGPTEAAVDVTSWACERWRARPRVPIGRPIANLRIHVLDRVLAPVLTGVRGELLIAGTGLARGYLGRPGLTAETFIPDPFSSRPGERLYRSGDVVRWLPDGRLDFLGRIDHQVKVRGLRIELGEVEAIIEQHQRVREAAVVMREDTPGVQRLVAYVVPARSAAGDRLRMQQLRRELRRKLPDYMVPGVFVPMDRLPLNSRGKIDRRSLPRPQAAAGEPALQVPPSNATERTISAIWQQVLGLERLGMDENFFELGGNSMLVFQVRTRLQEAFHREIENVELFR